MKINKIFDNIIVFRRSLQDCTCSDEWEKANIISIHKRGSKSSIDNYRGIPILWTINKVFEKNVHSVSIL